jgi:hypothetical protein
VSLASRRVVDIDAPETAWTNGHLEARTSGALAGGLNID